MAVLENDGRVPPIGENTARNVAQAVPLVIDMGKVKRSEAKKIAKGKGVLLDHVERAVQYTEENLDAVPEGRILVPVVIVYEKKRKKRRNRPFGFL
jgi:hypothetical protein